MDRERTIHIVQKEINRLESLATMGGFFANDHLETALAIREVLSAYIAEPQEPFVFREHRIRGTHPAKARRRR